MSYLYRTFFRLDQTLTRKKIHAANGEQSIKNVSLFTLAIVFKFFLDFIPLF